MLRFTARRPLLLLLCIAPCFSTPLFAQETRRFASECRAIKDDAARLACYDNAAVSPLLPGDGAGHSGARPASSSDSYSTTPSAVQASNAAPAGPRSMIDDAWGFAPGSEPYLIKLYRPNYLLFARTTDSVNNRPYSPLFEAAKLYDESLDSTEAAFQLSFKTRVWTSDDRRLGFWLGYTQQSFWQVYNSGLSKPFRETNYMPEAFVSYQPNVDIGGGFKWKLLNFGYNHQSNGRADPISRSWDRIFAEFGIERGDFALLVKPWYRIPEGKSKDDNPDIQNYYGYAEVTAIQKWRDHSFNLMVRGNPDKGKGAAQLTWMTPPLIGALRGYVKAFSGYGESMIDYNWHQNTIGVGVVLNDDLM